MVDGHFIGLVRDEFGRVQKVLSDSVYYRSERGGNYGGRVRNPGQWWRSERVARVAPLSVSLEQVIDQKVTDDYRRLPDHLRETLQQGLLRTSVERSTDYAVLMSVVCADGKVDGGRTGALLYRGEPVIVNIDGKEFVVEIKGVGSADGNNTRTEPIVRRGYFGIFKEKFGSLDKEEGMRELECLEVQRGSSSFARGDTVRAASLHIYDNIGDNYKQAYHLRLAPSTVRVSFTGNPAFPEHDAQCLAEDIGQQYAELAQLGFLHGSLHAENVLFTGTRYVMTDFGDCSRLEELPDLYDFLSNTLSRDRFREMPGFTNRHIDILYATIARGLGISYASERDLWFIDDIWSGFFASKVYELRKGTHVQEHVDEKKASVLDEIEHGDRAWIDNKLRVYPLAFLSREIRVLEHVDAPEAIESLRIARERAAYLMNADVIKEFKDNLGAWEQLFFLPYMRSR